MYNINIGDTPEHETNFKAIKKYRATKLQKELEQNKSELIKHFEEYIQKAEEGTLRTLSHLWTYQKQDTKHPHPPTMGDKMYDMYVADSTILANHENHLINDCGYILDVCPICGSDTTSMDWDHFAPRSKFPEHSLLYANLIPTCHRCNDKKGNYWPASAADGEIFNAFFDDIPNIKMLTCDISLDGKGFPVAKVDTLFNTHHDKSVSVVLFTIDRLKLLDIYQVNANKIVRRTLKELLRRKRRNKDFNSFWIDETAEMQSKIDDEPDINNIERLVYEAILGNDVMKTFIEQQ